jgi:uncharacterized protein (TIGR02118 family)
MFRISVCYGQPVDPAAFDEHYNSTHVPLTLKVPGLVRFTTGKPRSLGRTGPPHHLVADPWFETAESLKAALKSAEMQAASADVANFATGGVTLYSQQETLIVGHAES